MTRADRRACCATSSSARAGAPGRFRRGWSPRPRAFPSPRSTSTPWSRGPAAGPTGRPACSARSSSTEELSQLEFRVSSSAFFQTNTEMAERLYEIAAGHAELSGRERVFDLYCGIGTIGLLWRAEPVRFGGSRPSPRRSPTPRKRAAQRDRQRPLHRRRRAPWSSTAARARRPSGRGRCRPAPRGALKKVIRRVIECEAPPDRLRLLQPDHAGPKRLPADGRRL